MDVHTYIRHTCISTVCYLASWSTWATVTFSHAYNCYLEYPASCIISMYKIEACTRKSMKEQEARRPFGINVSGDCDLFEVQITQDVQIPGILYT